MCGYISFRITEHITIRHFFIEKLSFKTSLASESRNTVLNYPEITPKLLWNPKQASLSCIFDIMWKKELF